MKQYNDERLVHIYVETESSDAFGEIMNRYRNSLLTYLFSIVKQKSVADDIFQETFIKVVQHLKSGKYENNGKFSSWLFRIAHNVAIDYLRRSRDSKTVSGSSFETQMALCPAPADVDINQLMQEEDSKATLRSLICQLPAELSEVLVLRYYMDLSFRRVAEHLGVTQNVAVFRIRKGIDTLHRMIEKQHPAVHLREWAAA
ncbi:RNA polymerase subunit sigma-24 [Bacteroidia bacterium]|nr:RNA polymerase subunit sigma-24 [Bacteroidia bacterium]